jgi:hypothetical protein
MSFPMARFRVGLTGGLAAVAVSFCLGTPAVGHIINPKR